MKILESKMSAGFKNEKNERRTVYDELTIMKDEIKTMKMGSNCTVSSADWSQELLWEPREIEVKGWVAQLSMRQIAGLNDVNEVLGQFEEFRRKNKVS